MRKLLSSLLLLAGALVAPLAAPAQNLTQSYQATAYGKWSVPGYAPNSFTFVPSSCLVTGPSGNFVPFATNAPILILDANPALNETVTPSTVTVNGSTCTLTVAPVNQHFSFNLVSGSCGLQEALNTAAGGQNAVIYLTPDYANRGCTDATIVAAAGSSNISLSDQRAAAYVSWYWSGAAYVPMGLAVAPTLAAGTGAGTGPTLTIQGTGTRGTVTVLTGTTPTASAIIFTATFPTLANGGFAYAPTCTYTPYSANAYSSGTVSQTAGPPATSVLTASSTALAATTTYKFVYSCH